MPKLALALFILTMSSTLTLNAMTAVDLTIEWDRKSVNSLLHVLHCDEYLRLQCEAGEGKCSVSRSHSVGDDPSFVGFDLNLWTETMNDWIFNSRTELKLTKSRIYPDFSRGILEFGRDEKPTFQLSVYIRNPSAREPLIDFAMTYVATSAPYPGQRYTTSGTCRVSPRE